MRLSTKGEYAIRALLDLMANSSIPVVRLEDMATRQNIPRDYLEKIFASLRKAEIVASMKGQFGGYNLKKKPSEITIFEILKAVGDDPLKKPKGTKAKTVEADKLSGFLSSVDKLIFEKLKTTLDQL